MTKELLQQALDALCDVAFALPVESKTRKSAVAAELALRSAIAQPVQRLWVGLTDDEATALWEATHNDDSWELIKRVEAKLKEKNNDKPRN